MFTVHVGRNFAAQEKKQDTCDICDKKSSHCYSKSRRKRSFYKCSLCDSQFHKSCESHQNYIKVVQGKPLPCTICNKEFRIWDSFGVMYEVRIDLWCQKSRNCCLMVHEKNIHIFDVDKYKNFGLNIWICQKIELSGLLRPKLLMRRNLSHTQTRQLACNYFHKII